MEPKWHGHHAREQPLCMGKMPMPRLVFTHMGAAKGHEGLFLIALAQLALQIDMVMLSKTFSGVRSLPRLFGGRL